MPMSEPLVADMVAETSDSQGSGDMTLRGAASAEYRPFSDAFATNDQVFYAISQTGVGWETGIGVMMSSTVLRRVTVLQSSNNGSLVSWGAGRKVIYSVLPAEKAVKRSEVAVAWIVDGIESTPPGSPSTGDRYLVGDAPTGDWSTWENEIAEYDGSAWVKYEPDVGDLVIGAIWNNLANSMGMRALSTGSLGSNSHPLWRSSQWAYMDTGQPRSESIDSTPVPTSRTLGVEDANTYYVVDTSGSSVTVTIPSVGSADDECRRGEWFGFINIGSSGSAVTIDIDDSGTINGAGSWVVPGRVGHFKVIAVDVSNLDTLHWYVDINP